MESGLFGMAFGIGMLSTINPCGFALLPSYLAYSAGSVTTYLPRRLLYGLRSGIAVTIGFAATNLVVLLLIALGVRSLLEVLPWIALVIGLVLVILGLIQILGHSISLPVSIPTGRFRPKVSTGEKRAQNLLAFGVGYALASLGCSIGLLVAVIGQALTASSIAGVLITFGSYTLGAATMLVTLSLIFATTRSALAPFTQRFSWVRAVLPRVTGVVLLLAGGYLVIYWLPVTAGRGETNAAVKAIANLAGTVAAWVQAHQFIVALLGAGGLTLALGIILLLPSARSFRQNSTG